MLVTFTTASHADITLFGDVAISLLRMMGQSGNVPGAIMADDVGPALDSLRDSLGAAGGADDHATGAGGNEEDSSDKVPLTTRAIPLIGLLESAQASGNNVVWEQ